MSAPIEPPILSLPVFKSPTSVQFVPFHDSVFVTPLGVPGVSPPNAKADVSIPPDPNLPRAVFKSLTSVQLVPFHDSVTANSVVVGPSPAKAKAASALTPTPRDRDWETI